MRAYYKTPIDREVETHLILLVTDDDYAYWLAADEDHHETLTENDFEKLGNRLSDLSLDVIELLTSIVVQRGEDTLTVRCSEVQSTDEIIGEPFPSMIFAGDEPAGYL